MLAAAAGALGLAACGASSSSFCQQANTCEGGNDMDLNACEISNQAEADLADQRNCGAEYDTYFECRAGAARCNNNRYDADADSCQKESEQYNNCITGK